MGYQGFVKLIMVSSFLNFEERNTKALKNKIPYFRLKSQAIKLRSHCLHLNDCDCKVTNILVFECNCSGKEKESFISYTTDRFIWVVNTYLSMPFISIYDYDYRYVQFLNTRVLSNHLVTRY